LPEFIRIGGVEVHDSKLPVIRSIRHTKILIRFMMAEKGLPDAIIAISRISSVATYMLTPFFLHYLVCCVKLKRYTARYKPL
jgi:hypothetical protein